MKLPRTVTKRAATVVLLAAITALILWPRELLTSLALTLFAVALFKTRRYMHNRRQRPVYTQGRMLVYALAGLDPSTGELRAVKFGVTKRTAEIRCAEVDEREQTLTVKVLAEEDGDVHREQEIFAMLDRWRYPRSEWFDAAPPVLQVAAAMPRRTVLGQRLLRDVA